MLRLGVYIDARNLMIIFEVYKGVTPSIQSKIAGEAPCFVLRWAKGPSF